MTLRTCCGDLRVASSRQLARCAQLSNTVTSPMLAVSCVGVIMCSRLRQRVIELTGATADDFPDVPEEELAAAGMLRDDKKRDE